MTTATREFDPKLDYNVMTPNDDYKGTTLRQEFVNGHALVEGPGLKSSVAEQENFQNVLTQFLDMGYKVEVSKRPRREE